MANIRDGYLYLTRNDTTDIGTVESILEDLSMEADPFISEGAQQALDFIKTTFDYSKMRYESSVWEHKLPIYEPDTYDKEGNLK